MKMMSYVSVQHIAVSFRENFYRCFTVKSFVNSVGIDLVDAVFNHRDRFEVVCNHEHRLTFARFAV